MSTRQSRGLRNNLPGAHRKRLWDYVAANYTASKLNDVKFAERATADLGMVLTAKNIMGARAALSIASNVHRAPPKPRLALVQPPPPAAATSGDPHLDALRAIADKLERLIGIVAGRAGQLPL